MVYLLKNAPCCDHSGWNIPPWVSPLRRIYGKFQVNQKTKYPLPIDSHGHKQRKSCWFAHAEEYPRLLLWETDNFSYERSQWSVAVIGCLHRYENLAKFGQVSNFLYLELAPAKCSLAKDLPDLIKASVCTQQVLPQQTLLLQLQVSGATGTELKQGKL